MKFYDRGQEIAFLREIRNTAEKVARFTVVTGKDELSNCVTFCEIKRQTDEISIGMLKQRAEVMLQATHEWKKYDIRYKGLSMDEM